MNVPSLTGYTDNEFVLTTKRHALTFTHCIQVLEGGALIWDQVIDESNKPIASIVQNDDCRWETELDESGIPIFTREFNKARSGSSPDSAGEQWQLII